MSASGEICVNVLKRDWAPDLGLRHVLTVIRCLLIEPNAESGGWRGWAGGSGAAAWRGGWWGCSWLARAAAGVEAGGAAAGFPPVRPRHLITPRLTPRTPPPPPPAALNEEAGKLLLEGFEEFARKARLMTAIHARKPSVLTAAGGANAVNADGSSGAAADGKPPGGAAGSSGGAAVPAGAAKPANKAAAASLAQKKKSLKRL